MISTQKIIRMFRREYPGVVIDYTGKGHLRLRLPDGITAYAPASPSDHNFFKQLRRDIDRRRKEKTNAG